MIMDPNEKSKFDALGETLEATFLANLPSGVELDNADLGVLYRVVSSMQDNAESLQQEARNVMQRTKEMQQRAIELMKLEKETGAAAEPSARAELYASLQYLRGLSDRMSQAIDKVDKTTRRAMSHITRYNELHHRDQQRSKARPTRTRLSDRLQRSLGDEMADDLARLQLSDKNAIVANMLLEDAEKDPETKRTFYTLLSVNVHEGKVTATLKNEYSSTPTGQAFIDFFLGGIKRAILSDIVAAEFTNTEVSLQESAQKWAQFEIVADTSDTDVLHCAWILKSDLGLLSSKKPTEKELARAYLVEHRQWERFAALNYITSDADFNAYRAGQP